MNNAMEIEMTQFYFRHGTALTEKENARVVIGTQGVSGRLTRAEDCPRCGGRGGSTHWRPDGGVCYQCRGKCTVICAYRVFTAEKLAKLVAAADLKAAREQAKIEAKAAAKRAEFDVWAEPHEKLLGDIAAAEGNPFLRDLADKLAKHRTLSDKQLAAAATSIQRTKDRKIEGLGSEYVGEVKERIEFEAEVMGVYGTEGFYGHTDIVKFKDAAGNHFTWFASDYTDLVRGDRMTIKGTVKKHDDYKGIKQTILTRCKFEKFNIMTPDQAAGAEAVA